MYKIILPIRYLFRKRISYLAFLAVALCVFIVVVVMTIMTGLVIDFKQKNHSFVGDCVVGTESLVGFPYYHEFMNILEHTDFVRAISPVIKSCGLISAGGSRQDIGVEIMGIDPLAHSKVTGFGQTLYYHKYTPSKVFEPIYDPNLPGAVLGVDLALPRDAEGKYIHGSRPAKIALTISCFPLTAKGALAKAGTGIVNTKTFYYSDTSQSGLARIDSSLVYLPFNQAQMLCGMAGEVKRISSLHIKFKPHIKLEDGCKKVASLWEKFVQEKNSQATAKEINLLNNVTVQSWKEYRRAFIAAMEKERTMMIVLFALMGITTVFVVFVVFYMIISHKSKDIGILKSVGVSSANLVQLFLGFAFLVGLLGSCLGSLVGWVFLLKINQIEDWCFERFGFQLWNRALYAIGDIPNQLEPAVLVITIISAVLACLAGAIIPSWQAARLNPVETLRVSQL